MVEPGPTLEILDVLTPTMNPNFLGSPVFGGRAILSTGGPMPIIAMFYGIIIRMFYRDNQQHHLSHVHAEYLRTGGCVFDHGWSPVGR